MAVIMTMDAPIPMPTPTPITVPLFEKAFVFFVIGPLVELMMVLVALWEPEVADDKVLTGEAKLLLEAEVDVRDGLVTLM